MNSLQGPTASRPVREFRTSGVICDVGLFNFSIVRTQPLSLDLRPEVRGVASLSSAVAGLLRDFFKFSSGALNFKKSLRRQGIGFRRCFFRSFASAHSMSAVLRKTTEPIGSVHFRNVYFGRGTDSIMLMLHCVRTRPAGKEVRLRLVLFDARFILSGSVVHFVPDPSSVGERRRGTVAAGVPLLSTPSLTDSQSGIAPLILRSLLCRAYTLQGLQFLRCGCGIYAESAEPVTRLAILTCYNPSASTPSLKPLPPARLTRPKRIAVPP